MGLRRELNGANPVASGRGRDHDIPPCFEVPPAQTHSLKRSKTVHKGPSSAHVPHCGLGETTKRWARKDVPTLPG